ncbi:MAG: hypothetical protein HUK00_06825 [Bacteroidaceae bacterium]|nr:hypothetical protein [Bacteroidaceae bacterium]
MKHTLYIYILLLALCLTSCGTTPSEAVEHYYQCLMDSDFNAWIDGTLHGEAYTGEVRQERIDLLRQYLQMEHELRGGICSAKAVRDTTVEDNSYVFMELAYGDSTKEEILVPVVRQNDTWKMK